MDADLRGPYQGESGFHSLNFRHEPGTRVAALMPCPGDQTEQDRFAGYAAQFWSDGEAMCLAIAGQRGGVIATDDRKAIRVAGRAGLTVVSCPEQGTGQARETSCVPSCVPFSALDPST